MALSPRNIEAAELIAELPAWNEGTGIDAESWVGCVGSFELAIGYSLVFWPSFARIGQYVVISSVDEAAIKSWEDTGKYNRREIEAVLNHVHIVDLQGGVSPPSEAQARFIGRTLKSIYEVKLASEFPGTAFDLSGGKADRRQPTHERSFLLDRAKPGSGRSEAVLACLRSHRRCGDAG